MENNKLENIDKYLRREMTTEAATDFELKMKNDKALEAEVMIQKKLVANIKLHQEKQDFLMMLDAIKTKTSSPNTSSKPIKNKENKTEKKRNSLGIIKMRRLLAIAAAVTLFIIGTIFIMDTNQIAPKQLAQENFHPHKDILTPWFKSRGYSKGKNKALKAILTTAISAFETGDYDLSKSQFTEYKEQVENKEEGILLRLTDFYLAQIAFKRGDYQEAINLLTPLAQIDNLPFSIPINWYLGLSYLGKEDVSNALVHLQNIPKDHLKFGNQAQVLIAKLK